MHVAVRPEAGSTWTEWTGTTLGWSMRPRVSASVPPPSQPTLTATGRRARAGARVATVAAGRRPARRAFAGGQWISHGAIRFTMRYTVRSVTPTAWAVAAAVLPWYSNWRMWR